jgi:hypothetical protein
VNTAVRRGLPAAGYEVAAGARGWVPTTDSVSLDWPDAEQFVILGTWRHGEVPLALVEDEFIARRYLCSAGPGGAVALRELADQGLLVAPKALLEAAQAADWWAERGDTLYDLVAGCIDPGWDEAHEIWQRRLADEHPLIRLAACWAGPYLSDGRIVPLLEHVAAADASPEVRAAAETSASASRARDSSG